MDHGILRPCRRSGLDYPGNSRRPAAGVLGKFYYRDVHSLVRLCDSKNIHAPGGDMKRYTDFERLLYDTVMMEINQDTIAYADKTIEIWPKEEISGPEWIRMIAGAQDCQNWPALNLAVFEMFVGEMHVLLEQRLKENVK